MTKAVLAAGQRAAKRNQRAVEIKPLLRIQPRPFDEALLDASEMAGVMPTVDTRYFCTRCGVSSGR